MLVQAVVLFGFAGTPRWPAGWLYIALYVGLIAVGGLLLLRGPTEVMAERSKGTAGGKRWDIVITRLMVVCSMTIPAGASLQQRWDWSPGFPRPVELAGILLLTTGNVLVVWATAANRVFAQVVRIQSERGHTTVTGGPCRFVRHPGLRGHAGVVRWRCAAARIAQGGDPAAGILLLDHHSDSARGRHTHLGTDRLPRIPPTDAVATSPVGVATRWRAPLRQARREAVVSRAAWQPG